MTDIKFTGFKDKNGREIQEGDTLKITDSYHTGLICKIEWFDALCGFYLVFNGNHYHSIDPDNIVMEIIL